jgi:hypothetical protein
MSNRQETEALRSKFRESWDPVITLMNRAREVEFRIRIIAEILSNRSFVKAQSFEEFMKGPRKSQRKRMEKHIRDIFGADQERMILIRQCSDNLAHADYLAARKRVDQYKSKFGLKTDLTERKAGIFLYNNVRDPDGPERGGVADIGYIIGSSENNLILEEFEVFKHQGYESGSNELLEYAEEKLREIVPNLDLKYAALVASRGLKFGERRYKNP